MTYETLVITTDGSEPAEKAAGHGFDLAGELGAEIRIVSVADSSIATGVGYSGDSGSIRERLREKAEARATSLCDTALSRGLDAEPVVLEGIPAEEIVDYADGTDVDAIVIGTSGRGGVSRAVMGSVADRVVRNASVPVVTVSTKSVE